MTLNSKKRLIGGCIPRLVRSWLAGSRSTEPCLTTRHWQSRPDPAREKLGSENSGMTKILAVLPMGTSHCLRANHLMQTQEDLAQRRKDAKFGLPQFIPSSFAPWRLCARTSSSTGQSSGKGMVGKGMIEFGAWLHSFAIPFLCHSLSDRTVFIRSPSGSDIREGLRRKDGRKALI